MEMCTYLPKQNKQNVFQTALGIIFLHNVLALRKDTQALTYQRHLLHWPVRYFRFLRYM